jgi:hypothetical protein
MGSNNNGLSISLVFNEHKNTSGVSIPAGTPIKIWSQRGELAGTWRLNDSSIATSSDRNLKHDIKELDEKYDAFFDLIVSKTFKYNNGTSNRDHCGFIA